MEARICAVPFLAELLNLRGRAFRMLHTSLGETRAANSVDFYKEFKFESKFSLFYEFEFDIFISASSSSSSMKIYQVFFEFRK